MSYKLFAAALALVYVNIIIVKLLFMPLTPWNVFYERQATETFYAGKVPVYDALSYEGRQMTFVPGYFAAKAGFMHLAGIEPSYFADLAFETLANIAFILSLVLLSEKLRLKFMQSLAFILMISMSMFTFILLAGNLMHTLSLALLFFSLLLMLDRKMLFSGIVLAASSIVHAFSIGLFVMFALTIVLFRNKAKAKGIIFALKPAALASVIFLISYLPTLLSAGMPTQALPREHGYLISWGIGSALGEFLLATPLVIAALLFNKNRRLSALLLIFIVLYSFVSFRLNVPMVFAAALLLSQQDKKLQLLSVAMIMLNIIPIIHIASGFSRPCDDAFLTEECTAAMQYISMHRDAVLAGPIYGHILTYHSMPVVADAYVEYADERRLRDAIEFERTEDISIAEKYNASALSQNYACTNSTGYDLVYDNGYLRFCRRR